MSRIGLKKVLETVCVPPKATGRQFESARPYHYTPRYI